MTRIAGGIAANVIPDRVECHVNFRYAPGRTRRRGRGAAAPSCAPATASCGSTPTRRRARWRTATRAWTRSSPPASLVRAPKQAWTPVAEFGARRPRRRSTSARATPRRRTAATSRVEIAALGARLRGAGAVRAHEARPGPHRPGDLPVRAPRPRPSGALLAAGVDLIDFGIGEPREETPAFIRDALVAALEPALHLSPRPTGCPSCARRSPAGSQRRFGAALDPDTAGAADARLQGGDLPPRAGARRRTRSRSRRPAYPVLRARRAVRRQGGARAAAARGRRLPARPRRGRREHLGATSRSCGSTTRTTRPAATAPLALYERAAALAREHGFVLACDEAYSEIYFGDEPPASALQLADLQQRRWSSTRSPSARRCPATGRASWPATRS